MLTDKVAKFFSSIRDKEISNYNNYWSQLQPRFIDEAFKRYVFAFLSVHTTWENNCKAYNILKDFNKWKDDEALLHKKLVQSGVGMQNNRTKYLNKFIKEFWADQAKFVVKEDGESWTEWRDRLVKSILGLGKAKVSFALEMMYPVEAQVACMDTHLFQVYGLDQSKDSKHYNKIEADWVDRSNKRGLAPYMARCLYWDKNQNRKNSRYWSKVLEN